MLRRAACAVTAVALVCIAGLARAQEDYSRLGCYVGLAGTIAFPLNAEDFFEIQTGSNADVDDSLGLHARVGCRGAWVGGEVHFEWLDGIGVQMADFYDEQDLDAEIGVWALTIDGKLYPLAGLERKLPALARRVEPFATIGFGYMNFDLPELPPTIDADDWDFVARFGGGLEIYVTRNIVINVDATYVLPVTSPLDDLDYISVGWGVLYRF